jgi:SAM-dependent methyltransferase
MLRTARAIRRKVKPLLPPVGHKILRTVWYTGVLKPMRAYYDWREAHGLVLSDTPPPYILTQYNIAEKGEYFKHGDDKVDLIERHLSELGLKLPAKPRIFDFGCGAAGVLGAFERRYPDAQLFGCDLKEDVLAWVKKYRPQFRVELTDPMPPLPADFTDFDLIFAISVWTHMPVGACEAWLAHMHERLKSGGVLFFTIVDPHTDLARKHGFEPATLTKKVEDNGGCWYDPGTDHTYIIQSWVESQIAGKYTLRYYGPGKGRAQWSVVLTKN